MQLAVTLVHKGAMPIGVHAVRSFARHFHGTHRLDIHTDGSPDAADEVVLLEAAAGMEARIVRPAERRPLLDERLAAYPRTRALLDGVGYFAKLELPITIRPPYFYFDSDIVWLRPVSNLAPSSCPNAFSTESWSWYNGITKDRLWINAGTPRRVNSGFYYLGEPFPHDRMEDLLAKKMFDPNRPYPGDQEIMAYLYPRMELYHPEDFKRSRVGLHYDLQNDESAALHFPGRMWQAHLQQIEELERHPPPQPAVMRFQASEPLTRTELNLMRLRIAVSDSHWLGRPVNWLRSLRRSLRSHLAANP